MYRLFPTRWTALYMSLTGIATWVLCESDALIGTAPLLFH
jgi:hypothetical protein